MFPNKKTNELKREETKTNRMWLTKQKKRRCSRNKKKEEELRVGVRTPTNQCAGPFYICVIHPYLIIIKKETKKKKDHACVCVLISRENSNICLRGSSLFLYSTKTWHKGVDMVYLNDISSSFFFLNSKSTPK